jgi:hypothetical protein
MAGQQDQHDDTEHDFDDAPDGGGGETGRIRSLDALAESIARLEERVTRALGAGQPSRSRPEPGGSESSPRRTLADGADERRREIREELAALKSQEKADAERGEMATRLGKIEQAMEKPPRQLRRIEELMGWHRS